MELQFNQYKMKHKKKKIKQKWKQPETYAKNQGGEATTKAVQKWRK